MHSQEDNRWGMRRLVHSGVLFTVTCALWCGSLQAKDKPRKPTPPADAKTYTLHEAHEGITVAAEPGDTKETRPDTRLDYFHHGFLPLRVIVTNDTAQPLSLDDARILFVARDNYTRNAATDDDLARRMFSKKYAEGSRIPLPAPLPSITLHHPGIDKTVTEDGNDFGFSSTTVAPHSTLAGYLFYDTRDIDDPVLEGATLEIRRVRWASTNKELPAFEIHLKPSAAKPDTIK
jgi:hypothetical protein